MGFSVWVQGEAARVSARVRVLGRGGKGEGECVRDSVGGVGEGDRVRVRVRG